MVNLKEENDGYERRKISHFQAVGAPSAKTLRTQIDFGLDYINNYDWSDRPVPKTHRNILVTPVGFGKNKDLFNLLPELKEEGLVDNIMFDSGGFQVLTGSLESKGISTLADLQKYNEELYNEYDWADIYIMPDHPPNLTDEYDENFQEKVDNTVEASLKFFECLKPEVQAKSAPVFHIRRDCDIESLYQQYKPILDKSKFASFSASSLTNPGVPRRLRSDSLLILDYLQKRLSQEGIGIHCLGVASPPSIFMLAYMGIRTFDASTPIIAAGNGKVFFPYMGGMSCSIKRDGEEDNMTLEKLKRVRKQTNHRCPFCEDIEPIKRDTGTDDVPGYMFRRFHNFCTIDEMNWHYRDLNADLLLKFAPQQHKDFMLIGDEDQITFL